MKFAAAASVLFAARLSTCLAIFGLDHVTLNSALDVPGNSPLHFCKEDRAADLVIIDRVDLDPNPPHAGSNLSIVASGTAIKPIEKGAYVNLQVKYNMFRFINTRSDLCEAMGNVDMACPIEEGPLTFTKQVELPREIPPGQYSVWADVYSKDDQPVTCLTATVTFSKDSALVENGDL